MAGKSDPLRGRLGALTARELLAARARARRANRRGRSASASERLVEMIDLELERRRAARLGTTPSAAALKRLSQLLDEIMPAQSGPSAPGGPTDP